MFEYDRRILVVIELTGNHSRTTRTLCNLYGVGDNAVNKEDEEDFLFSWLAVSEDASWWQRVVGDQ